VTIIVAMSDVTITTPCPSCDGTLSAELKLEEIQRPALFTVPPWEG
jgi:hypothetical protein